MPTDSKTAGHTAPRQLPLRADIKPDVILANVYGRKHPDGGDYAALFATTDHDLAAYIVTAVNSHAANLRKIEALRDALRTYLDAAKSWHECHDHEDKTRNPLRPVL